MNQLPAKNTAIVDPWRLLEAVMRKFDGVRYITTLGSAATVISPELAAHV